MNPKPMNYVATPAYPTRREFLEKGTLFLLAAGCGGCGGKLEAHPVVAPIFAHGDGRAYMGCVAVSSPVFLSEEEALQIIKEELAKEGIELGAGMTLAGVSVEFKDDRSSTSCWLGEAKRSKIVPGELDAVDRKRQGRHPICVPRRQRKNRSLLCILRHHRYRQAVCRRISGPGKRGLVYRHFLRSRRRLGSP